MNISAVNQFNIHKLNLQNAQQATKVNLPDKNIDIEKLKESMKKAELSSIEGAKNKELKLTVVDDGTNKHFRFIKDLDRLSAEEKALIQKAIDTSIAKPAGGSGDLYKMHRAQASAQLNLIAQTLLPEQYRDQMTQAIQAYNQEEVDREISMFSQAVANLNKSYGHDARFDGLLQNLNNSVAEMQKGTHFQNEQERQFSSLYANLNTESQSQFMQSFENIMQVFKQNQQSQNVAESVISEYQDSLRNKWNDFASIVEELNYFKLPTIAKSVIDMTL